MCSVAWWVACASLAACPPPPDSTAVIPVSPRAAQRWAAWQARDAGSDAPPRAAAARVAVMKAGEELGGPNAVGRPGDLVLSNDEVVFVVDQLGAGAGFAESGGNLVDAADARARKDELGQVFTYFGVFPRQAVYDRLTSGVDPDGGAWVEAAGHELYEPALAVVTRYVLRPGDRALSLKTTVQNDGSATLTIPSLGDAIQWGGTEKAAPGKAPGFKGESSGAYVGGVGRFTSYALTSTDGTIDAVSGSGWTDTVQRRAVTLGPREKVDYARVFLVGERPDTTSLVSELTLAQGQPVGELEVRWLGAATLPTGALVTVQPEGAGDRWTLAPPFTGRLPVGAYRVRSTAVAADAGADALVRVDADRSSRVDLAAAEPASLDVTCVTADGVPSPCKITFEGLAPTPAPSFGAAHASGPAGNQLTTADGHGRVLLAPGHYRLTASRGPEYALATTEVALAAGQARTEALSLRRVVDTRGYLACDFHQHTMLGMDAPVGTRDRVIGNGAEGVEIAVATEHNVVADLEPLVHELHLERDLVELSGDELTSDASRHAWGHANAFPLVADPNQPRGGAPLVRDRTPGEVFAAVRAAARPGAVVIQVNHPRSGRNGYFDLLGFDRAKAAGADPSYDAGFDAVEVWNGRNVEARAAVLDDWRALLRAGRTVTATANTDTHGVVGQEAGYPRTYVRVADDEHLDSWDDGRTRDLVAGIKERRDVVLTDGPMLRVTANGAPIGGLAAGRSVVVQVHVECAPWVDVDTVRVVRARDTAPTAAAGSAGGEGDGGWSKAARLQPSPSGALAADLRFDLRFDADDALFVVASGKKPLSPVLAPGDHEMLPWAMTGAIWIDADGDGRALGRTR